MKSVYSATTPAGYLFSYDTVASKPLIERHAPVAAVIAWFAIDERFTPTKIIGAVVTLAGVALAQFGGSLPLPLRRSGQSVGMR